MINLELHPGVHHEPQHPHLPMDRHSVVSIEYESDKLKNVFGDMWSYHIDQIAAEPPEIKILFAIELGLKITVNQYMIDALIKQRKEEVATGITSYGFSKASLDDDTLNMVSSAVCINKDAAEVILIHAPEGVVSTVIAAAKNKVLQGR